MDSEEVKWLKKRYCPTPTDGDVTSIKRVKFDDIKHDMIVQFPTKRLSVYQVSNAITTAFPNTYSRASTHNRKKHIFGLEKRPTTDHVQTCATPSTSREAQLTLEIQQLQQQVLSQQSRICELEKQVQESSALSPLSLESQVEDVLSNEFSAYHGPNTISHFHEFSLDRLVSEFKECAPDVWQLIDTLGNSTRFEDDYQKAIAESRVVSIMSCILKCRSQRTLGLQLLITLMLIARATSRRVSMYLQCTCMYLCAYKDYKS